jgi:hypothetical protein
MSQWTERIAAAIAQGAEVYTPNGLPVKCHAATGLLLECEHGDDPRYILPVEAVLKVGVAAENEPTSEQLALIYVDERIALTLSEYCYDIWSMEDGDQLTGSRWHVKWRLTEESLVKARAVPIPNPRHSGPCASGTPPQSAGLRPKQHK